VLLAILHRVINRNAEIIWWSMDCYPDALERSGKLKLGSLPSRIMRWLNRAIMRRINGLVCLDTAMVDLLVSQYAPPKWPVKPAIIPNWEDLALFPRTDTPPPWPAGQSLGLQGKFVVLYLGNTGVGHAFETALDAAEKLRDEPVVFLFIGGGSRWKDIAHAVKSRSLTNVIQHDYVAKELTPAVMGVADLALITLRDEALGVMSPSKLHANLAAALPVLYIGPPASNVDDAIQRFDCGVSLRHGDVEAAVTFIRTMMSAPPRHARLRQNARDAFEHAYCDAVTLPQFDAVIEGT
jgi:glycosyltransferase involved in cell wall biosynthesis